MRSQSNSIRIGGLDSVDFAIVILVWGTVIGALIGGLAGTMFRYSCFGIAAIVGILKIFRSKLKIPMEMFMLFLFIFIAYASVFISIEKTYSFARATNFAFLWFFLLGVYLSMESKSLNRILTTLTYSYLSVILINFAVLFAKIPSAWWGGRFQGIVGHPNIMAGICMATYPLLLMLVGIEKTKVKQYLLVFAFCVTFLIHIFTKSRASLAFSILGVGLYFSLLAKKKLLYLFIPLWLVSAVFFANYMYSGNVLSLPRTLVSYVARGESSELMSTFSGRTELWAITLQKILEQPLFGYGYDVEGSALPRTYDIRRDYVVSHEYSSFARFTLHNGYLSIFIGVGLTGFIIWLYLLFRPFFLLSKLPNTAEVLNFKRCLLMMMIMGLCMNLFEYTIDGGRGFFSIAFWILWTVLVKVSRVFPSPIFSIKI